MNTNARNAYWRRLVPFLPFWGVSLLVWLSIKFNQDYTYTYRLPVRYELGASMGPIEGAGLQPVWNLRVRGKGHRIARLSLGLTELDTLPVDLGPYLTNRQLATTEFRPDINRALPSELNLVDIEPGTLRLDEHQYAIKTVPIRPRVHVPPGSPYRWWTLERLRPDSVRVVGSDEELANIHEWPTQQLTLNWADPPATTWQQPLVQQRGLAIWPPTTSLTLRVARMTETELWLPVESATAAAPRGNLRPRRVRVILQHPSHWSPSRFHNLRLTPDSLPPDRPSGVRWRVDNVPDSVRHLRTVPAYGYWTPAS